MGQLNKTYPTNSVSFFLLFWLYFGAKGIWIVPWRKIMYFPVKG